MRMTKAPQRWAMLITLCGMPWLSGAGVVHAQAAASLREEKSPSEPGSGGPRDAEETLAALALESKPKRQLALFRTAALDPKLQELGTALDPIVLSELNTVGGIEVAARPSLDLPAMQLAIDCVGEIAECMAQVTREAGVDALVAPVLRSNGDLLLVTLLYFDARENAIKDATRQLAGRSVAQAMLDAVPEMVREVFGMPPESTEAPPVTMEETPLPALADERWHARRIVPWALLGVSVATGAVGIGMGVASNKAEDRYAKGAVGNEQEINATRTHGNDARDKALIANICFGVAGAAAIASFATWLSFRESTKDQGTARSNVALAPVFARGQVGLSLQGVLGR